MMNMKKIKTKTWLIGDGSLFHENSSIRDIEKNLDKIKRWFKLLFKNWFFGIFLETKTKTRFISVFWKCHLKIDLIEI